MSENFLVTGAASGFGRAVVERLLARGHRVLATDVDLSDLRRSLGASEGERLSLRTLDPRVDPSWRESLDWVERRWGLVDGMFHAARVARPMHVVDAEAGEIARHVDDNIRTALLGTAAAATCMARRRRGHVVLVAAAAPALPSAGFALGAACREGVRAFARAAADDLANHGVAVTVLLPELAVPRRAVVVGARDTMQSLPKGRIEALAELATGRVLRDRPREVVVTISGRELLPPRRRLRDHIAWFAGVVRRAR